jgi:Mn2+/Fe2+ NRAMP family transporter
LRRLGPGLITGAAADDPRGIATYSQAGAQFGSATVGGVILCFSHIDPVKELFWSAVLNGVIVVPIMAVMMLLASRQSTMGDQVIGRRLRWLGWNATGVMTLTLMAMFATL